MGNIFVLSKEEWIQQNLSDIMHKFGNHYFTDNDNQKIEWYKIENYLHIIYDYKYKNLSKEDLNKLSEISNFNIIELQYYY
jgi:hypothetical protein